MIGAVVISSNTSCLGPVVREMGVWTVVRWHDSRSAVGNGTHLLKFRRVGNFQNCFQLVEEHDLFGAP